MRSLLHSLTNRKRCVDPKELVLLLCQVPHLCSASASSIAVSTSRWRWDGAHAQGVTDAWNAYAPTDWGSTIGRNGLGGEGCGRRISIDLRVVFKQIKKIVLSFSFELWGLSHFQLNISIISHLHAISYKSMRLMNVRLIENQCEDLTYVCIMSRLRRK